MKKIAILLIALALLFCGCGKKAPELGPADVLDNDTGAVYHLGDQKAVFDEAFGSSVYNEYTHAMDYLSKMLSVEFDEDGSAVRIEVDGGTNRFSFYGFDFSKSLADIKGRYKETVMAGSNAYSTYFSVDGKALDQKDAYLQERFIVHSLHVRTTDQEITGLKAGDYVFYSIEYRDGLSLP